MGRGRGSAVPPWFSKERIVSTSVKVMAVFVARAGKAEELRALLAGMVSPTRAELGNVEYNLWRDKADLGRFVLDERYRDDTAVAAHHATAHYAHYLATITNLADRTALVLEPLEVA